MNATNIEIAKAALCSEGAVRKARERLDLDDLGVLLGWVLGQRVKELGLGGVDGLAVVGDVPSAKFPRMVSAASLGIPSRIPEVVAREADDWGYVPCDESGYEAGDFN